ncbi:MAG: hypothetical protein K0U72_02945 [Gammaproteobacteria bacterium]|nr:hypothetical protein [Gammaproteobacteria bacterium]
MKVNGFVLPASLSTGLNQFPFGAELNSLVAMAVFPRDVITVALEEHRHITEYFHGVVKQERPEQLNKREVAQVFDFSRSLSTTILESAEHMERDTEKYRPYAPYECGLWLKDSSASDGAIELPYLDIDSAVVLSDDEFTVRYALDYRGLGSEPSVLARYFSDNTIDYSVPDDALGWHQVAETLDEFLGVVHKLALD